MLSLSVFDYAGTTFAVVMAVMCLYWLTIAAKGMLAEDIDSWARQMFKFSIIVLLVFSLMISIDAFLP